MNAAQLARFEAKVQRTETCWLWLACTRKGYGLFRVDGRMRQAHVVAFEHFIGAVPPGCELDHTCRTRRCCNPAHVDPVTSAENKRRSPLVGRHTNRGHRIGGNNGNGLLSHCTHGHPFSQANTYVDRKGGRHCRSCNRDAIARWKLARAARRGAA